MDQKQKDLLELIQSATKQLNILLKDVREGQKTYDPQEEDGTRTAPDQAQEGKTEGFQEQKESDPGSTQTETRQTQGLQEQEEDNSPGEEKEGSAPNS